MAFYKTIVDAFGQDNIERLLYEENITGSLEALTEGEGRAIAAFRSLNALRVRINDEKVSSQRKKNDTKASTSQNSLSTNRSLTKPQATTQLKKDKRLAKLIDAGKLVVVDGEVVQAGVSVGESSNGKLFYNPNHDTDAQWDKKQKGLADPWSYATGLNP